MVGGPCNFLGDCETLGIQHRSLASRSNFDAEDNSTHRLQYFQPILPTVDALTRESMAVAARAVSTLGRASAVAAAPAAPAKDTVKRTEGLPQRVPPHSPTSRWRTFHSHQYQGSRQDEKTFHRARCCFRRPTWEDWRRKTIGGRTALLRGRGRAVLLAVEGMYNWIQSWGTSTIIGEHSNPPDGRGWMR